MATFRALTEIELDAAREEEVDDLIHAAAEVDGRLPDGATIWVKEISQLPAEGGDDDG